MQTANVTVATDGTFTGAEQSGCTFTGKVTPRTRGNVFDQSLTFGGAPCFFAGSTFQGIVYFDIPTRRLYMAAPNSPRTDAAIFLARRFFNRTYDPFNGPWNLFQTDGTILLQKRILRHHGITSTHKMPPQWGMARPGPLLPEPLHPKSVLKAYSSR